MDIETIGALAGGVKGERRQLPGCMPPSCALLAGPVSAWAGCIPPPPLPPPHPPTPPPHPADWDGGLVLVSHDFRLISQVAKEIWEVADGEVRRWDGSISDYKAHLKRRHAALAKRTDLG